MIIGGLILAGGRSTRMGGVNKALLQLDGKTYIERVAEAQNGLTEHLLSVAPNSEMSLDGYRTVRDRYPDMGPIGGLYSALCETNADALLVMPCDVPYIKRDIADMLVDAFHEDDDILIIDNHGKLEPLIGIYSVRCIATMKRHIETGRLSMRSLGDDLRVRLLPLNNTFNVSELKNINQKEDILN